MFGCMERLRPPELEHPHAHGRMTSVVHAPSDFAGGSSRRCVLDAAWEQALNILYTPIACLCKAELTLWRTFMSRQLLARGKPRWRCSPKMKSHFPLNSCDSSAELSGYAQYHRHSRCYCARSARGRGRQSMRRIRIGIATMFFRSAAGSLGFTTGLCILRGSCYAAPHHPQSGSRRRGFPPLPRNWTAH